MVCTGGSALKSRGGKIKSAQNLGTENPPPLLASLGVRILAKETNPSPPSTTSGGDEEEEDDEGERAADGRGSRLMLEKTSSVSVSARRRTAEIRQRATSGTAGRAEKSGGEAACSACPWGK